MTRGLPCWGYVSECFFIVFYFYYVRNEASSVSGAQLEEENWQFILVEIVQLDDIERCWYTSCKKAAFIISGAIVKF